MCLRNIDYIAKSLAQSKRKRFTCYKVLFYNPKTKKLTSAHKTSYEWQPGENRANGTVVKHLCTVNRFLYIGIHTYREPHNYQRMTDPLGVFVSVKLIGLREDLRGANENQLLFTKVYLSRREYNKTLKVARELAKKHGLC